MTEDLDPFRLGELAAWRSAQPATSLIDYLAAEVRLPALVAVAGLFHPALAVERGCVLLRSRFESSNFEEWWAELGGDRSRVEAVINHVHLWDLFDSDPDDPAVEPLLQAVARALAASWRCVLADEFPDRRFEVVVGTDEDDYGPTVTFHSLGDGEIE